MFIFSLFPYTVTKNRRTAPPLLNQLVGPNAALYIVMSLRLYTSQFPSINNRNMKKSYLLVLETHLAQGRRPKAGTVKSE
jgi:hypothetical protein